MIGLLLTRWKWGLGLFGALAVFGLFAASWHYRNAYHAEKALRQADRAAYGAAQAEAALIAQRALGAAEAKYRTKANEADQSYRADLADARAAADRYIAAHRVRNQALARDASGALASAPDRGPGVPASLPADAFVAVSDSDVQACTEAVTYAVGAHEWALGLIPPPAK